LLTRAWASRAHLVSTDLAHWTRLPSALSPNGDWDGSLTIMDDGKPVIMYDCYNIVDCRPPNASSSAVAAATTTAAVSSSARSVAAHTRMGDPPHVGVARPVDADDANLTNWHKDPLNPISFPGMKGGFAGPSNIFAGPDGHPSIVMALGRGIARFESVDPRLHNWTVADPSFLPWGANNGHGTTGVPFFPLPPTAPSSIKASGGTHLEGRAGALATAAAAAAAAAQPPTHMLGGLWSNRHPNFLVGTPWLVLGRYDNATGSFTNVTEAQPIDSGNTVIWSTLDQVSDGRTLHVGWFNGPGNS
jgi:hypothetical protein